MKASLGRLFCLVEKGIGPIGLMVPMGLIGILDWRVCR